MNRTYAYLRNVRKIKFRMVSAQHFINETPGLFLSGPKVLFSDKIKFCISFVNQDLEKDWRGTESKLLEAQCKVSEVSDDLACRDICWCWSIVFYPVVGKVHRSST